MEDIVVIDSCDNIYSVTNLTWFHKSLIWTSFIIPEFDCLTFDCCTDDVDSEFKKLLLGEDISSIDDKI